MFSLGYNYTVLNPAVRCTTMQPLSIKACLVGTLYVNKRPGKVYGLS